RITHCFRAVIYNNAIRKFNCFSHSPGKCLYRLQIITDKHSSMFFPYFPVHFLASFFSILLLQTNPVPCPRKEMDEIVQNGLFLWQRGTESILHSYMFP